MNYRKYSLYNAIGALIWGMGITFLGYLLGQIPVVADFAAKYIDLVLISVVIFTLVPTVFHYVQSSMKARKAAAELGAETIEAVGAAEELVLDPEVFNRHPKDKRNKK
jgi:membrane-associated protein